MIKISVIMPVYNSEKYLHNTIESVLNQDMDSFELILVDDGSSDSSGEICDSFARLDDRVVVVHKENGGICSARNCGIMKSRGEYIAFCDNDDLYLPGLLKDNYNLAKEYGADVVRFGRKNVKTFEGKRILEVSTSGFCFRAIKREQLCDLYPEVRKTGGGIWAGIYRREFLSSHDITFDERMRFGYEDYMFNLRCYAVSKVIVLNPKVYYSWLQRIEHSTTGKYDPNALLSLMHCASFEQEFIQRKGIEDRNRGYWSLLLSNYYIAELYNRIRPETKNLTNKDRLKAFRIFRNTPKINYRISLSGVMMHLKQTPLTLPARLLFQCHLYWSLYIIFDIYMKINSFRLERKINTNK